MTITEFLLARFDEDEGWARAGSGGDTRRALAEVNAKRRIVEAIENHRENEWDGDPIHKAVLVPMAEVYSDHPDYDEAWADE